jgi:uncharacterized protein
MLNKCLIFLVLFIFLSCEFTLAQGLANKDSAEQTTVKQYFFVMLLKGPQRNQDSITSAGIQEGHMSNIRRLAKMGKILVAGPFGDEDKWRGLFIFDCKTRQEVEEYLKTDPAVVSGRLTFEIHPWWTGKNCLFQ